jgi:hypothetical protein
MQLGTIWLTKFCKLPKPTRKKKKKTQKKIKITKKKKKENVTSSSKTKLNTTQSPPRTLELSAWGRTHRLGFTSDTKTLLNHQQTDRPLKPNPKIKRILLSFYFWLLPVNSENPFLMRRWVTIPTAQKFLFFESAWGGRNPFGPPSSQSTWRSNHGCYVHQYPLTPFWFLQIFASPSFSIGAAFSSSPSLRFSQKVEFSPSQFLQVSLSLLFGFCYLWFQRKMCGKREEKFGFFLLFRIFGTFTLMGLIELVYLSWVIIMYGKREQYRLFSALFGCWENFGNVEKLSFDFWFLIFWLVQKS